MLQFVLIASFLISCSTNKTSTVIDPLFISHVGSFMLIEHVNRNYKTYESMLECEKYGMHLITTLDLLQFLNYTDIVRPYLMFRTFHNLTQGKNFVEGRFEKRVGGLVLRERSTSSHIDNVVCNNELQYKQNT